MKGNRRMKTKTNIYVALALFAFACFALSPRAQAVSPPPDGGYSGFNTAEGDNALLTLTTGVANTAVGWFSLKTNAAGSFNTSLGAGTLLLNTADNNTATGAGALLSNTTGSFNTANGAFALQNNTTGSFNAATGRVALLSNTIGNANTADGEGALLHNTFGYNNTGTGANTLFDNTTGFGNIALGGNAGNLITGDNNIAIGNIGVAAEANTIRIGTEVAVTDQFGVLHPAHTATYIAGISGQTASGGVAVYINSDGKLGTLTSSARFKTDIKPMDNASEAILALKPVTFRYKQEIDNKGIPQFGLVAEDVEKVNPELVARDADGKPYSVRYEAVNAMLLNEFLKQHRQVQEQKAIIAQLKSTVEKQETANVQQQKQIAVLAAGLQKVSAKVEMSRPAPRTAKNQ
jgi:Chaperone of endosialidase